jgi:GWxTD domain-containing protein
MSAGFISPFVLALLLGFGGPTTGVEQTSDVDYYQQGREEAERGKWRKALRIWQEGKQVLESQGLSDPRIGIAYIQLATEKQATSHYAAASDLYFWGFTRYDMTRFRDVVEAELARLEPILEPEQLRQWKKLLAEGDTSLNRRMREFWEERDPAPSTRTNERLLEHWQRIAYARKNFRKGKSSVYGTDDRGLIYVKYGEPDRRGKGRLGSNRFAFRRWTNVLGQYHGLSRADEQRIIRELDRYNPNPEFEIWIYTTFNPQDPAFYLFGPESGTGSFGLRNGVEDFIPTRAFRRTSTRYTAGLLPGAVLQAVYYGELVHFHNYFVERLRQLDEAWIGFESAGVVALNSTRFRTLREYIRNLDKERMEYVKLSSPPERSTLDRTLAPVDMTLQPVRLLDEANQPEIAFIALTIPQLVGTPFWDASASYEVRHNLLLRDEQDVLLQRLVDALAYGEEQTTTFRFPHRPAHRTYEFIAEVLKKDAGRGEELEGVAPELVGIGRYTFDVDTLLSDDPRFLELSDLIIGSRVYEEISKDRLPFPVVPMSTFLRTDVLKVYLEVYHLALDSDGMARFTIDLRVARLRGRKRTKKEMISLGFDRESPRPRSSETFDVDLSNLPVGEYEILVEVTDTDSGQKKSRTAVFEVVYPDQR